MSGLIPDKLITKCGEITNSTNGGYIDAAGNVVGSAGFLNAFIVDYAGNIGSLSIADCTFIATIIGSAIDPGAWEMQLGTTETVEDNLGTISNNFVANPTPALHSFVSINAIGYLTGVVSGIGTWTIKAGPETIAGTGYIGGGLLVSTGANTHSGTVLMELGTKLQLGADCTNAVTRVLGNLTLNEGAIATQYTSFVGNTYLTQALNNNGTYNVTGCGACGVGGLGLATTVVNNGTINLDKTSWRNQSTWSGTGTVNVKAGATFQLAGSPISSTTNVNINGCGWCDATGANVGALHSISTGITYAMRINVQSASCIKLAAGASPTFGGLLVGNAALNVSSLSATKPSGVTHFTNTANPYNGTMTVDGSSLNASYGTSLQYAKIVLANGGRLSSSASQTVGSLASTDATTYWSSADSLNHFIKNNGETTFAGRLLWNGGSNTANWWLEGGSSNVLTLTGIGSTGNFYARNGSKVILQGGTFTGVNGQIRVQTGSTVSAGLSTTSSCVLMYIDATSAFDVRALGAGTGIMNIGPGTSLLSAGWKVNALDPLAPGTYPIIKNTGAAITQLPAVGINNTGGNVSYVWNNAVSPKVLNMIVS
jgi:hypothetical protein